MLREKTDGDHDCFKSQ